MRLICLLFLLVSTISFSQNVDQMVVCYGSRRQVEKVDRISSTPKKLSAVIVDTNFQGYVPSEKLGTISIRPVYFKPLEVKEMKEIFRFNLK